MLKMKRRMFLQGAAATLVLPKPQLFVPKAPAIIRAALPIRGGQASASPDAMTQFLATLASDEWGQPANTTASAVYYANDTGAPDYNATTAADNTGVNTAVANWTVWSGGAHDTIVNRGIIGPGGLHFSYCGNEGYAFDFGALTWHRMRTPSDAVIESGGTSCTSGEPVLNNGDEINLHLYSTVVFLPDIGTHGSLFVGVNQNDPSNNNVAFLLDLSKGYPYEFPTTTGAPASGWKRTATRPFGTTTPAICAYDQTTQRIVFLNQLVGGGPPNSYAYDIGSDSWITAGFSGPHLPNGSDLAGGLRDGHRELWAFGDPESGGDEAGDNAVRISLVDGSGSAFQIPSFLSYVSQGGPGVCYVPPLDEFWVWFGGNTLQRINCTTAAASDYVTTGGIPAESDDAGSGGTNNGALTKMWCDTVHHCIVLAYSGDTNVYVLKTSLF